MTWLDYFATADETMSILSDFCARGLKVIPDLLLDEPTAPIFDHVSDELVRILKSGPGYFLAGSFTVYPVHFVQLRQGPAAGKFRIDEMAMGPVLTGEPSRVIPLDGMQQLLPGRLSYHRSYRNPQTGDWEGPSPELKSAMRDCVRLIRQHCVPYDYKPGLPIVIGEEALALLKSGTVHIDDAQIVPSGKGLKA